MDLVLIISTFIILLSLCLIHVPKSLCQHPQFLACGGGGFQCGDINFTFPFWTGNEPNIGCGYPGFQVSCHNGARMRIGDLTYIVLALGLDYSPLKTVTVTREDMWNNTCSALLKNTTLDSNIFSYASNTQNLTLFYGCPSSSRSRANPSNEFTCVVNGTSTRNFFTMSDSDTTFLSQFKCNSTIHVPVHQTSAQNLMDVVGLSNVLRAGFTLQYEANNTACEGCIQSGGRCGYNYASSSFVCYCFDRPYDLACSAARTSSTVKFSRVAVTSVVIIILIYCLAKKNSWWEALIHWKSKKRNNQLVQEFIRNYGSIAPKLYTYSEIKKMTSSFKNKLGHGGYGCVYKGTLSDGREVAVKVLNDNKGNGEDFINEVAAISRTSHVNVVNLLGFCYNRGKRALIYEFMPNGSLDKFITKKESSQDTMKDQLEWELLYKIAVGIARGLEYLHQGCNTRIVHFDIKPQNILLDRNFCPKISDFGLAKLYKRNESILTTMTARGTIGYVAPEVFCRNFGGVSHKSDIYSYGMMVLEMVGLRRKLEPNSQQTSESYFPNWIYEHVEDGKSLPVEGVVNDKEEENAMKMILVGLWCIQTYPADRPSISKVVEMLEGSLHSLEIPPKPFIDSPIDG
ncbi:OLC1v1010723C1 [Oldenlandia corymbosa var. corymbosa]|uniref:non-specific serine/threonine protein kinase n=1 Tax=Oldenlandia corymbosa var. corymbosa TaxID=529605 RepID=A0AAV1DV75_OLDCO|nr:OLC1v1010723C1 [Oldenlandia corymbosa var. corymbosa]